MAHGRWAVGPHPRVTRIGSFGPSRCFSVGWLRPDCGYLHLQGLRGVYIYHSCIYCYTVSNHGKLHECWADMWHVEHVMYSTEIRMVDNVLSPILYMTLHTMVYLCMSGGVITYYT